MFDALMPLHILMCDEVILYFIIRVRVVQNSNLFLNSKSGLLYKSI
jgi:hypothetical protein